MKVDTREINPAFKSIIQNPDQTVFLDANFFIPPDRSEYLKVKPYAFGDFKDCWLIPLLSEFSGVAVHESVYDELKIYRDKELSDTEVALMNCYISKLAIHSQYDPTRDNAKDRGEVKSLSFMAVKQFLFFAANDALPVRLIKEADKLDTGLDNLGIVQMYELIYYLCKTGKYDNKRLRILYKYQYYLSQADKKTNPDWGTFMEQMDKLYEDNHEKESGS